MVLGMCYLFFPSMYAVVVLCVPFIISFPFAFYFHTVSTLNVTVRSLFFGETIFIFIRYSEIVPVDYIVLWAVNQRRISV